MSPIKKSGHNLKLTRLLSANAVAFTEQSCLSKNLKRQKIDIVLFRLPIPTKTFVSFRLLSLTKVSLIASPQQQCVTALLLSAVVELFFPRVLLPVLHEFPKKNTRKGCFFVNGGEAEIRTLGGLAPSTVFKTAALNHSATSPLYRYIFRGYRMLVPKYFEKVKSFFIIFIN